MSELKGLSIDQLSDLKIAIIENKKTLETLETEKQKVSAENVHLKSENTRLNEEIQQQVFNKENLVKENDELREEKQKIYDEYNEKQGKRTLELEEKQEKLNNQEALVNARLEELSGREKTLVNQKEAHEKDALNFDVAKKEYELQVLHLNNKEKEVFEKEDEVKKKIDHLQTERKKYSEEYKKLEQLKEAVKDSQNKAQIDIENNNKILQEISIKTEENEAIKNRYETLIPLYNEVKDYIIKNTSDWTAENFMTLENVMFKKIEEEKINYFKKKEEKPVEEEVEEVEKEEEKEEVEEKEDRYKPIDSESWAIAKSWEAVEKPKEEEVEKEVEEKPKEEVEKEEEKPVEDWYEKMSYKELKELAKKHWINFWANPKTANLIAIIREFDKNNQLEKWAQ